MAAEDALGRARRISSFGLRQGIVEQALAPGASVAAGPRQHGLESRFLKRICRA